MKKKLILIGAILSALLLPLLSFSTTFKFINELGRKYRFKNLNRQEIYQNGVFYKNIESLNKAMLEVVDTTNGFGYFTGKYYYYEKNVNLNESYKLKDIYESRFYKNEQGQMIVSPQILMPSLRSIPSFLTNDIKPGESWTAKGEEIHEGILVKNNILRFPVDVNYTYIGDEKINGKLYSKISIDYHIFHYPKGDPDIFSFTGFSHSIYYWDEVLAAPSFYNEDYAFMFTLLNGETVFYKGASEGKVDYISDITNQQKADLMAEMSSNIVTNSGISVREVTDGIIVNLGNILFDFNEAKIKKEFEKKLDAVAEVLRKYPQIDIVVSGHTDNIGNPKYNMALSENRAKAVSDYLMGKAIAPTRLSYIGHGDQKPLADNTSENGRSQNRRVEIKLITRE